MRIWDKEDPHDVDDIRKKFFGTAKGDRENVRENMQRDFDKLKADGKIPESLYGMLMSEEIKLGIKFLIYQSMHDTKNAMSELARKSHGQIDKPQLFLNYSNMILQVTHALIEESLTFQYKLVGDLEEISRELYKFRDSLEGRRR
jgi:hypothetical protein